MQHSLKKSIQALQNKQTILYPTDTIWGIGCDATDEEVVAKIYSIKQREESKSLIVLVASIEMLQNYIEAIPKEAVAIITSYKKPTTIIYDSPKNLAKNTIATDQTIAIRVVRDGFAKELIQLFGKPIVSTSANRSGEAFPKEFSEISETILTGVDYIVNLHQDKKNNTASRIIKIDKNGKVNVIRD